MKKKKLNIIIITFILAFLIAIISFKIWVNNNINSEQIPVLMYHNVVPDEFYKFQGDTISVSEFENQMKYLKNNNYKTLTLDEFYCWKKSKCEYNEKSVVLTFDDGFYSFHYLVEPILKKYDFHAVDFVIGSATGDITKEYDVKQYGTIGKDIINEKNSNTEYGSHSYSMHKEINGVKVVNLYTLEEMDEDFKKMKEISSFKYYSYPFNTKNEKIIKTLEKHNYKLAFYGEAEKAIKDDNDYMVPRIGISKNDMNKFKSIFETQKYNNRYKSGLIRKIFVTLERKLGFKLF